MYAIVDIAGQQFKVEKDMKLYVHRLEVEEGKKVSFDRVLLIDTGDKVSVGDPLVKGATVNAKVLSHLKGDKVLVFKKKRRKGFKKLNGHRQYMTEIQIEGISEKAGAARKEAPAAKQEAPSAKKEEAPKTKTAAEKKPAAKASAAKAGKTKQPAAKATTAKKPAAKATASKAAAAKKPAAKKAAPKKESGDKAE
jgi:large subunit ribosomal protein L21